mmetsp:Transcript_16802/g.47110  ORF Transcript_16802/g.47110 Transcript_16802/m.47110 type:complete len:368 (-) Transcript_16802:1515-2618(-)
MVHVSRSATLSTNMATKGATTFCIFTTTRRNFCAPLKRRLMRQSLQNRAQNDTMKPVDSNHGMLMHARSQPHCDVAPSSIDNGMIADDSSSTPIRMHIRKTGWRIFTTRVWRFLNTHSANAIAVTITRPNKPNPTYRIHPKLFSSSAGITRSATSKVTSRPTHPTLASASPPSTPKLTLAMADRSVPDASKFDGFSANCMAMLSPAANSIVLDESSTSSLFVTLVNPNHRGFDLSSTDTSKISRFTSTMRPSCLSIALFSLWYSSSSSENATFSNVGHGRQVTCSAFHTVFWGHSSFDCSRSRTSKAFVLLRSLPWVDVSYGSSNCPRKFATMFWMISSSPITPGTSPGRTRADPVNSGYLRYAPHK